MMGKECKQYESFEELPQELKDKFKYNGSQREYDLKRAKNSFLNFINELNKRGDELIGDYTMSHKDTTIKFHKCGHSTLLSPKGYVYNGNGCAVCHGRQILIGYNDVATTHPHLVKYFVNIEDAYAHTAMSGKKVMMKCPHCDFKKEMFINTLTSQGFGCNRCGDGISYPEKVVMNVLENLDINFKFQFEFDDYKQQYKYDFHLTDLNTIIEINGEQHYYYLDESLKYKSIGGKRGRNGIEEHENDMYKYDLAVLHGYEYNKNYFVIDARESNIEWLQNSIEQCEFFEQFDLSSIDWQEIDIKSQKSLKIEVCNYWREHKIIDINLTTIQVAQIFKITQQTVIKYLKWGNENGFCEYNSKEEIKLQTKRLSKALYFFKSNGEKWFNEPISLRELSRRTNISTCGLKGSLLNKRPLKKGNSKFDPKYVGSYVVLAEEYDLQFNRNNSDSNNNKVA